MFLLFFFKYVEIIQFNCTINTTTLIFCGVGVWRVVRISALSSEKTIAGKLTIL